MRLPEHFWYHSTAFELLYLMAIKIFQNFWTSYCDYSDFYGQITYFNHIFVKNLYHSIEQLKSYRMILKTHLKTLFLVSYAQKYAKLAFAVASAARRHATPWKMAPGGQVAEPVCSHSTPVEDRNGSMQLHARPFHAFPRWFPPLPLRSLRFWWPSIGNDGSLTGHNLANNKARNEFLVSFYSL